MKKLYKNLIRLFLVLLISFVTTEIVAQENPPVADDSFNYLSNVSYDYQGRVVSKNLSFYNYLGEIMQSQSFDARTGLIWVNETKYDYLGRPVFKTLAAPIKTSFAFQNDFIQNRYGSEYSTWYFDGEQNLLAPQEIGEESLLGNYYSEDNTVNNYQDITKFPFSRVIYSKLNPGTQLKVLGGKKFDVSAADGEEQLEWLNSYKFAMKGGTELSSSAAFGEAKYSTQKIIKTVGRDVNGVETVSFSDIDGNHLATARSGNEEGYKPKFQNTVNMTEQGYVDIHIPKGCSGISISGASAYTLHIFDLTTEKRVYDSPASLQPGLYRVAIAKSQYYEDSEYWSDISIQHNVNYYDYSLNYYDKGNRLVSSKQPLDKLESIYDYNSLGQVLESNDPDRGSAKYKYQTDGKIRFSQNAEQALNGEVSYTNYDKKGRPVESGVIHGVNIDELDPDVALPGNIQKSEVNITRFDLPVDLMQELPDACTSLAGHYQQKFLSGNVSMTKTEKPFTSYTIYSYDVQGRVTWTMQFIQGMDCPKTIDYTYDSATGLVSKVDYQRYSEKERFIHKYQYDISGNLTEVKTSLNDVDYKLQAKYFYSVSGELIRKEIGEGLQGIDYVYNLEGQLKAINHPSLDPDLDPGHDGEDSGFLPDLFGMSIDYNSRDYLRENTPTRVGTFYGGENRYDGNIKSTRWKNEADTGRQNIYHYKYDKNKWLNTAEYGLFTEGDGFNAPEDLLVDDVLNSTEEETYKATRSVTFGPGFKAPMGSEVRVRFVENEIYTPDVNEDYKVDNLKYDANGNILSLRRRKNMENGSNDMDDLSYSYYSQTNQLNNVSDRITGETNADDIKSQLSGNYEYNEIGQLVYNAQDNTTYTYNTSGLVTSVSKPGMKMDIIYNDRGQRAKKITNYNNSLIITYYIRDLTGNAISIYTKIEEAIEIENPIYGKSRIGLLKKKKGGEVSNTNYLYELTDHLGNVRVVLKEDVNSNVIAISKLDYYPFGMKMPNKSIENQYRYAFQGQESDEETGKDAFELRIWDSRIGRWLSADPYFQYNSPFLGFGNNPINRVDPDGGFDWYRDEKTGDITWIDGSEDIAGYEHLGYFYLNIDVNGNRTFYDGAIRATFKNGEFQEYHDGMLPPIVVNVDLRSFGAKTSDEVRSFVNPYIRTFSMVGNRVVSQANVVIEEGPHSGRANNPDNYLFPHYREFDENWNYVKRNNYEITTFSDAKPLIKDIFDVVPTPVKTGKGKIVDWTVETEVKEIVKAIIDKLHFK